MSLPHQVTSPALTALPHVPPFEWLPPPAFKQRVPGACGATRPRIPLAPLRSFAAPLCAARPRSAARPAVHTVPPPPCGDPSHPPPCPDRRARPGPGPPVPVSLFASLGPRADDLAAAGGGERGGRWAADGAAVRRGRGLGAGLHGGEYGPSGRPVPVRVAARVSELAHGVRTGYR